MVGSLQGEIEFSPPATHPPPCPHRTPSFSPTSARGIWEGKENQLLHRASVSPSAPEWFPSPPGPRPVCMAGP